MNMDEILKALLGGAGSQQQGAAASGSDALGNMLGSLLGGGAGAAQDSGTQQGGLDMGSLMQAILGGAAGQSQPASTTPARPKPKPKPGSSQQETSGLGDLLGALLGGGSSTGAAAGGTSAMLAPIAEALANKLGLPSVMAQAVVAFVIAKLLSGAGQAQGTRPKPTQAAPSSGLNLDVLLGATRSSGMDIQPSPMSGLAEELSSYTGLDTRTAEQSLVTVFDMLGSQSAAPRRSARRTRASAQSRSGRKGS